MFYEDLATGSFYAVEGETLMQYPMLIDGTMENNPCEVELDDLIHEMPILYKGREIDLYDHLSAIRQKLIEDNEVIAQFERSVKNLKGKK